MCDIALYNSLNMLHIDVEDWVGLVLICITKILTSWSIMVEPSIKILKIIILKQQTFMFTVNHCVSVLHFTDITLL